MNIELPRIEELDRPLRPSVNSPTFGGRENYCNHLLEPRRDGIDPFLNSLLDRSSPSRRVTSTGSISVRRPRNSRGGTRCNVKYTDQQIDFIDYFRVDQHLSWKEVEAKYAAAFPEDAAKGHKRGPQGLQGVYYRKNKQIPVTDPNNLLVFDEDDNPKTFQCDVREQGKKMNSSIGLLSMHPERAITYPWVSEKHKRQCEKLDKLSLMPPECGSRRDEQREIANF
ncbi:hypothetical protein CT0861_07764 [Colletotrichum tofieldiae]|uniref:Uncharacterized protein n=1 Tax=Colletotrichum tofieldiae TaxID=708197 RepID=A0A161WJ44_9PEZI|nr:hypothetical protein CT0861_07764 [Colletotrichum tofieldiae]